MSPILYVILGIIVLMILVGISRALLSFWEDQAHLSEDDIDLERRVASLNDRMANQRRDDDIVRILSGQDAPTLADRDRER